MSISTARPADIESRATLECWRPAANADITAVTVATSRPMAISDSKRVSPLRMGVLAHLSAVLDWRQTGVVTLKLRWEEGRDGPSPGVFFDHPRAFLNQIMLIRLSGSKSGAIQPVQPELIRKEAGSEPKGGSPGGSDGHD